MKWLIILFPVLFMVFSCTTNKINKNDLEWQPYKEGDVLVFESNKGELDTIDIKSIEVYINPDDPLAVFPKKIESHFVIGQQSILEMTANDENTDIKFTIKLGNNNLKYPGVVVNIQELKKMIPDIHKRYVIVAKEYYDNLKDIPFDLLYIYWSKEYGYLGLEFKGNYIWTLKSFIRDGNEIL